MDIRDRGTQKTALAGIAALAVLYVFFFTEILPFTFKARAAQAARAQAHCSRLSADVTKARAAVANLPAVEAEYAAVKARWESMSSLLPSSKEIASLLTKVTVAGQESGVDFALFQPAPSRSEEFFVAYPAQYRVEGGYHQVGRFMAEVANMDRIVNITDIAMNATEADDKHPEKTVVAAFTAEAYAFQDSATAARSAAGAPGGKAKGKAAAKPAAGDAKGKKGGKP
jgi:type IV pilus assembly protein PilO